MTGRPVAVAMLYLLVSIPASMPIIGWLWGWDYLPLAFFVGLVPIFVAVFIALIVMLYRIARYGP